MKRGEKRRRKGQEGEYRAAASARIYVDINRRKFRGEMHRATRAARAKNEEKNQKEQTGSRARERTLIADIGKINGAKERSDRPLN